ncbi:lipopolysaccharide assembly protein LapB [Billgrantia gudaonensis]|uniref:Lipopolysaccharide assembly protein B n=1 Tax=Billgrantia gudaonensis TaxID=376427 RepID=A0A1G8T981_9GAMM|nr:lipopolysaccharide assembly protein LapB [Halomonas gudaonensis]SDJ37210.1 Lipopolysaccharide biosynthesis regulator YciM, contains six TPR domains and a predicted metal-binding C-terminal domain [Halomonas gudaonensis]
MPDALLLSLLVAAVAIGWWLGRRERHGTSDPAQPATLTRDYFVGLNYLLNEQPDRAIEAFVAALEVNSDTIDTHITLGNLFRTRGEADRAVKIHQNLLARPTLTTGQSEQVQLELSRDFLKLGLLDRAERLLQQLVRESSHDPTRHTAKQLLVELFDREGEWQAALDVAHPTLVRQHDEIRRAAAHWLCELAAQARQTASPGVARKQLRQALSIDPKCVRANLSLAALAMDTARYREAIRVLMRIPDQDLDFVPTMLEPLQHAHRLLDDDAGLATCLEQLLARAAFTSLVILLAETRRRQEGVQAAIDLVTEQLDRTPSLGGLDYLLDLYYQQQQSSGEPDSRIRLLKQHTHALLQARPRHRCQRCGLTGEPLHWQCPRCRSWGTTRPITGIEGE